MNELGNKFSTVWTLRRGIVNPPEPLDDANQRRAHCAWREATGVQVRVEQEWPRDDARVVWNGNAAAAFARWGSLAVPAKRRAAR